MKGYFSGTCGFGLIGLLVILAGTAAAASAPRRAVFDVTLQATVTKDWNTVVDATEDGCSVSRRSVGRRTVTLHSARPSRVVVTFGAGGASYSPGLVRSVTAAVRQTGTRELKVMAPCRARTVRSGCARMTRSTSGGRVRFFRSARNEISFHSAALPGFATSCPTESTGVRSIRPGLQQAQGAIDEASLASARIRSQTSFGTSEVTSDLDGAETGRVVERVRWALTFTRRD